MKVVILDFTDWKVKIVQNIPKAFQVDDVEEFLYKKYNFSTTNIEFMIVTELEIETLN